MTQEGDQELIIAHSAPTLEDRLVGQVARCLTPYAEAPESERQTRLDEARRALESLDPGDELEGMLAVQMVATHDAALECLRRTRQDPEAKMYFRYAATLSALFTRQLEALERVRAKRPTPRPDFHLDTGIYRDRER